MVLIQGWPPHLALAPMAQVDPPLMPFRDAGYSQADYTLTVQDVVYGVFKAKTEGCCALDNFDLDEYEKFERVDGGDFNWISPHFLAFASPDHGSTTKIPEGTPEWDALPKTVAEVETHPKLPTPFKNVLKHFSERNIGLVVRLNSPLYSPSWFESLGIQHLDMIFDDGTCPTMQTVRKFIRLAHETIVVKKKSIAVHCKAGLGRTGCLIGAYLIYRHGFTADEVIAFMRFMRPGMVVGPQQHWLHMNQGTFREWWVEERVERRLRKEMAAAASVAPTTPVRSMQKMSHRNGQTTTPARRSASNRSPLSEVNEERNNIGSQEDYLPAPTPGQPRKTNRADRHHPYQRTTSYSTVEEETIVHEDADVVSAHQQSGMTESDEEFHRHARSPGKGSVSTYHAEQKRSYSQTSVSVYHRYIDDDASQDAENITSPARVKTMLDRERASSASGVLTKVRGSKRGAESPLRSKDGVRKTSGRIGSISGVTPSAAARKVSNGL